MEQHSASPAAARQAVPVRFPPAEARSVPPQPHGSLEVRSYAPRQTDPQTPHTRDALFVAAGVEHRFTDFTPDFGTWTSSTARRVASGP